MSDYRKQPKEYVHETDCECRACRNRHLSTVQLPTDVMDHMSEMSDELLRLFLVIYRMDCTENPYTGIHDFEVIKRVTGMSDDRIELAVLEGIRKGLIRDRSHCVDGSMVRFIGIYAGAGAFFNSFAPRYTVDELLRYADALNPAKPGYIYVLHSGDGFYKIGQTVNMESRLRNYATHSPRLPDVVALFTVNHMDECESALHHVLSAKRVRGEWFQLNEEEVFWFQAGTYNAGDSE